ncbi:MAG: hypothetical protein HOP30_13405 [Cyclobacteriaceae bacterium]|nr:hypothetical protein [Cyclobacteriaceae bacterium]
MKPTFQILTLLIFFTSCSTSKSELNDINNIEIGMTVNEVIGQLKINDSDLYIIQEPPLIYRGINAVVHDSIEIGISFERTPANPNNISKKKGLEIVKNLKINGFAWKIKNGEGKVIGERPKFWTE